MVLAVGGIVWCLLRGLHDAIKARDYSTASFAAPLLLAALLAHSAVDFDWSYAADFAIAAILAGFVVASRTQRPAAGEPVTRRIVAVVAIAGVAVLGVAAGAAWSGDLRQSLPLSASPGSGGVR
jgi:hypothetical protein